MCGKLRRVAVLLAIGRSFGVGAVGKTGAVVAHVGSAVGGWSTRRRSHARGMGDR
jgi:hypothetical protein